MLRIVLVIVALLYGGIAQAQSIDAALDRLAADSFTETEAAIGEIATSGAPNAQAILEAMAGRRLLIAADKRIVYTDASGATFNAGTGKATEPVSGASPVRLNNKLRGVVEFAIGLLRLFSPDRQKRLEAAESVFKSKDLKALPALEAAIAKEADAEVKTAFVATRSVLLLAKPDASDADRVAAIEALAARGNQAVSYTHLTLPTNREV